MPRTRTALLVLAALAASTMTVPARAGDGPSGDGPPPGCVRPAAQSPARCTFDVWGRVFDSRHLPVAGALVSDGARSTVTDASGFYDLFEPRPGAHSVTARYGRRCARTESVNVDPLGALQDGGARLDPGLPCAYAYYDAFGFGVVRGGVLSAVARRGLRHAGDPGGLYQFSRDADGPGAPAPLADTADDDRDAAGGLTRSGALVAFWGRFSIDKQRWNGVQYMRSGADGVTTGSIRIGVSTSYSPYGPLVVLPSGRLMQTFYGREARGVWRLLVSFSSDDGRTWDVPWTLFETTHFNISEAAAAYLDGATDDTARLVMVARAYGYRAGAHWAGLIELVSLDGGRSWKQKGLIDVSASEVECIPWITTISGGRVMLAYVDRGSMTLKVSITPVSTVLAGPAGWGGPRSVYRSRVLDSPHPDIGDFGYPSIVSYGPSDAQKAIVFSDIDVSIVDGEGRRAVNLLVIPAYARLGDPPIRLSA